MTQTSKHIHHFHRHMSISYPVSVRQRLYSLVLIPLVVLVLVLVIFRTFGSSLQSHPVQISLGYVLTALVLTFLRLGVAYFLSLVVCVPLAILISHSARAERILLPMFDIIQSVPVLAFFPVIILLFVHYGLYNGAAIFILFLAMLWNLVFSVVGGMRVIPQDVKSAAQIFHISGWQYVSRVLIPAVLPYLVTGSLLAFAQGWNVIIVAEVLHTYIPGGTMAQDLFGVGSLLVNASASGNQQLFIVTIVCMVAFIGLLNFFVWQKLLRYAERFKFE